MARETRNTSLGRAKPLPQDLHADARVDVGGGVISATVVRSNAGLLLWAGFLVSANAPALRPRIIAIAIVVLVNMFKFPLLQSHTALVCGGNRTGVTRVRM